MSNEAEINDLSRRVNDLPWYHSIELPGGIITPGVVRNARVVKRLDLPASLVGKTVMDVGAWDGFYSFECARRGAERVLATDSFVWDGRGWGSKRSFELAREALDLVDRVDDLVIDPMDLAPDATGGPFDVVLFLGVLYHLRDPIGAIERVASCCRDLLVLETETALNWLSYPAARVYPGSDLNSDPTNWYQYNVRALIGLVKEFGFESVEVKYRYPLHRRIARASRERVGGRSFRSGLRSSRVVLHARKAAAAG